MSENTILIRRGNNRPGDGDLSENELGYCISDNQLYIGYKNEAGQKRTKAIVTNTAGSTDTSSKIFLVGATSQAANPQTYSDNQVYATNGQLDANKVRIGEAVSLVYDSTNKCLNFNFT